MNKQKILANFFPLSRLFSRTKKVYRKTSWLFRNLKLKDIIPAIKHYKAQKTYMAELKNNQGSFCITQSLRFIDHYQAKHISGEYYLWKANDEKIYANLLQFHRLLSEYLSGVIGQIYDYDFRDKTIIDIGSYVGESATFFLKRGAKKVICYEPVPQNLKAIALNLKKYKKQTEVFDMALGGENGFVELCSDVPLGELSFGGHGTEKSKYKLKCKAISLETILMNHQADIVKMDCEGAEHYITSTPIELIKQVPYWIIETHSQDIYDLVFSQMHKAGFSISKFFKMVPGIDVVHFFKDFTIIQKWYGNIGSVDFRILSAYLKSSSVSSKEINLDVEFEILKNIPDISFNVELLNQNNKIIANIELIDEHQQHLTFVGKHMKRTMIGYNLEFKEPCSLKFTCSSSNIVFFHYMIMLNQQS